MSTNKETNNSWRCDQIIERAKDLDAEVRKAVKERDIAITKLKESFGQFKECKEIPFTQYIKIETEEEYNRIKERYEECLNIAKENDEICKHNNQLVDKVIEMLANVGFKKEVHQYKRSKSVKVEAKWLTELKEARPKGKNTTYTVQNILKEIDTRWQKRMDELAKAEQTRQQQEILQQRERLRTIRVTEVANSLNLNPVEHNVESLIKELRNRDKYLDLAIAMSDTRGDWSDGCYKVKYALDRFRATVHVGTEEIDKDIATELSDLCRNWDFDGRVFRDCVHNYTFIFNLVDRHIFTLYDALAGFRHE